MTVSDELKLYPNDLQLDKDAPRKEPFIKLESKQYVTTYEVLSISKETGKRIVAKKPIEVQTVPYYFKVSNGQYNMDEKGSGPEVIMKAIQRRERKGHIVLGFGNFPKEKTYEALAQLLRHTTKLSTTDPKNPVRVAAQKELIAQLEEQGLLKKGAFEKIGGGVAEQKPESGDDK